MNDILLEVCASSVMSALAAQEGGASRVELCENISEGGTTPSCGSVLIARKLLHIGLNVLIRPRGGDFLYNEAEFEIMKQDVIFCRNAGADGIVTGILDIDGKIDNFRMAVLIELARPMSVTFHRAFDMTQDPFIASDDLAFLGIDRLLTSGQKQRAVDGIILIADLIRRQKDKYSVMPGSGINEDNIVEIIRSTGAHEVHVSARSTVQSDMKYKPREVRISTVSPDADFELSMTDAERVRTITGLLKNIRI